MDDEELVVVARHIRDDRDIVLDKDQIRELDLCVDLYRMYSAGIRWFELDNGWRYQISKREQ